MNLKEIKSGVLSGHRLSLARAMTLVESERKDDQQLVDQLITDLTEAQGPTQKKPSLRIGITGVPGVGKSTFIEALGLNFIEAGYRVAVLAIDPSSRVTQGSILGDKTRMEDLSKREEAFIRPTPSRGHLGGIAVNTRDCIRLCEHAGYDFILIETVGVGQSETLVADLVDTLMFLALPGAGDELQGIKKGLLEHTDRVVVNKSEGPNRVRAELTKTQLSSSLRILKRKNVQISLASALAGDGIAEITESLIDEIKKSTGEHLKSFQDKRASQDRQWLSTYMKQFLLKDFELFLQDQPHFLESLVTNQGLANSRKIARTMLEKFLAVASSPNEF